ncbi:hypothetical protein [Actinocorallia populi]|nr:hypothetical protein [Actinocorallia populi]
MNELLKEIESVVGAVGSATVISIRPITGAADPSEMILPSYKAARAVAAH